MSSPLASASHQPEWSILRAATHPRTWVTLTERGAARCPLVPVTGALARADGSNGPAGALFGALASASCLYVAAQNTPDTASCVCDITSDASTTVAVAPCLACTSAAAAGGDATATNVVCCADAAGVVGSPDTPAAAGATSGCCRRSAAAGARGLEPARTAREWLRRGEHRGGRTGRVGSGHGCQSRTAGLYSHERFLCLRRRRCRGRHGEPVGVLSGRCWCGLKCRRCEQCRRLAGPGS